MAAMWKFPLRWIMPIAVIVIVAISLSLAEAQNKAREAEVETNIGKSDTRVETAQVLDLLVINKQTKEPIAGAELDIRIDRDKSKDVTDERGRCKIALDKRKLDYLSVKARKKGFVPVGATWRLAEARTAIPAEYPLTMEPATSIGGIIQDEDGNPIKDVKVNLMIPGGDQIEWVDIWHQEKTDANGHWQCDFVPSKLDRLPISLAHPDYISDEMFRLVPSPQIEKLRNMTAIMVMKKGLTMSGRILDMNEQPIEGAKVAQSWTSSANFPSTKTDSEGRFKFKNAPPGKMVLTVQAKGYSPDLRQITVHKGVEPVEFRLEPGHTIRGRIVDTTGNPIAGAFVVADTWRGHRSLEWRVDTDSEGRFQWDDAPADEVLIDMGKQRYMSISNYGMSASDKEYVITLYPELKVRGKVVDTQTGEPITQFKLLPGIDWGSNEPVSWQRRSAKTFTQGHYEVTFDFPYPAHLIRVEADGYEPGISRHFKNDEGEFVFDFALNRGTGPTGMVYLPDGKPAAGAEVILCTPSQRAYISNGRNVNKQDSQFVEIKEDGRFSFPAQTEIYSIVALHERGYLEMTREELATSPQLTLQPWARVEGKLLIGKEPGANKAISLWLEKPDEPNSPRIYHDCRAVTDNEGQFVFERVAPGKATISRELDLGGGFYSYSHSKSIETKAGETISVNIGGTGRPVIGQLVIPDDIKDKFYWRYTRCSLKINSPENPYKNLNFKCEEDGSFRVDDVPAGDYCLYVTAYEPPSKPSGCIETKIGLLSHNFNVPDIPGGRSDEPLNIGTLELVVQKCLRVGDVAPLFEIKTLDGKDLKLANFRGKVVLLDFWATWCGPCIAEVSKLKELYDAFGKDEQFVMIGLSLDRELETVKEYVAKNELKWLQSFLGQVFESGVVKDYGVMGIPAKFLIDADGKIIAKNLGTEQLKSAISKALKKVSDER